MEHDKPPLSINLIGAGNLGKTLARLWHDQKTLSVRQVFTRNQQSANNAIKFIGSGSAHTQLSELEAADILLIAVPDSQIQTVCDELSSLSYDMQNTIVFHCSGVMSSAALNTLSDKGASVASIHPIKSFAHPESAVTSFEGTFCGVEGDQVALASLQPLFRELGGKCVAINADNKALYHCAAVFANNYMVSIVESAQELYQLSGIDREQSMQLMAPMLRETCENLIKFGTQKSLTGPIARSDKQTIEMHLSALRDVDHEMISLYQSLGQVALRLKTDDDKILNDREMDRLLTEKPG